MCGIHVQYPQQVSGPVVFNPFTINMNWWENFLSLNIRPLFSVLHTLAGRWEKWSVSNKSSKFFFFPPCPFRLFVMWQASNILQENTYCGENNSHLLSMFKQNYAQSWVLVLIIQVKECSEEARHERCLHQWLYILKLNIRALVIKKVCAPCFDFEIWTQIDF